MAASFSTGVSVGGIIKFFVETTNIQLADKVLDIADKLAENAVTLAKLYVGYKVISKTIDIVAEKALGGTRDDQEIQDINPGSLHIVLRCFTNQRFLEVLADYESGSIKGRFNDEFVRAGIIVKGLMVKIENMEEVNNTKEAINKSFVKISRIREVFVPVPQECMGRVIGAQGSKIKQLQHETRTSIRRINGNAFGKQSGFIITGSLVNCQAACSSIEQCVQNILMVTINELVPQQYVQLMTHNYREIEGKCGVKITWPKISGTEEHVMFHIKGVRAQCEGAREMVKANIEYWTKSYKGSSQFASGYPKISKKIKRQYKVQTEYLPIILGRGQRNKEKIETTCGTKIKVLVQNQTETETILEIIGGEGNCIRTISHIRSCIISFKDCRRRDELGGSTQFACVDFGDQNSEVQLTQDGNTPKLNNFLEGGRYRIELENDYTEPEISDETISELKKHILTSLQKLHSIKDEKELMIDLWCHFGTVFVDNVDEEEIRGTISQEDVKRRLRKIFSPVKGTDKDSNWKVSFEEGIDPSVIDEDALPKCGDEDDDFFQFKLAHTQRRYDFGFITRSERNVRLKAWEGLPPETDEPPVEVKYILTKVNIRGKENVKAWICYPSVTVLRGEILTPNSRYDCRMKLRAGSRYVIDKGMDSEEEDRILCDYLSDCKFDEAAEYRMNLPEAEIPEGFECIFYRESEERMFSAIVDGECFTVIVLKEKGWDSDSSSKRHKDQFGIRVVMNSWSEALLSNERKWEPEKIADKLKDYMEFLSLLKNHMFLKDR